MSASSDLDLSVRVNLAVNKAIAAISEIPVGLPLVWVYVWDVIKARIDDEDFIGEELPVWNALWTTVDSERFTLEYGTEQLYEHIEEWLVKNGFVREEEEDV